jgi:ubiquinone/menaquinone biosynthesis C-methylase UbiE
MLDHTIRRARERGLWNVNPSQGDAQDLPYDESSFDAAILITVLGEIPDQDAALREVARVLRPGGRLIVGELFGDPHMVTLGSLQRRAEGAGLAFERRVGPKLGYFARFTR